MRASEWLALKEMGDAATWSTFALSLVTAIAAIVVFVRLRRRERRTAMADLHASLTSGETAQARHVIGTLLYSPSRLGRPSRLESISAYFTLIWALQRAQNVFRTHLLPSEQLDSAIPGWNTIGRGRMQDATNALTWNLREIAENVRAFHEGYGGRWQIEDEDAWKEVRAFINVPPTV